MDTKQYINILNSIIELKKQKCKDYNSGLVTRADYYRVCGAELSIINELDKKVLRLLSLATSHTIDKKKRYDSLLDIIGYCFDYFELLNYLETK